MARWSHHYHHHYRRHPTKTTAAALDVLSWLLVFAGLYWFVHSFFLAKASLSGHVSDCDEAVTLLKDILGLNPKTVKWLEKKGLVATSDESRSYRRQGCWMNRQVDSLVLLVIDALRFDFAYYNFPKSIGPHLFNIINNNNNRTLSSRLFQFVADPPTVTMQRLKALTTGGLPTFADISSNLGGASVEEDSWIVQLTATSASKQQQQQHTKRGLSWPSQAGFVGDDTWLDLYPNCFTTAYPYPSFNTRDLNTVDEGCEAHLAELLQRLRVHNDTTNDKHALEVVVVHFLGVDHVGHTYGPHNEHMDAKLRQMDIDLEYVLTKLDAAPVDTCQVALVFGDHGMTEDGNHGGGTAQEINAALFVHASPGCSGAKNKYSNKRNKYQNKNQLWLEQTRLSDLLVEQVMVGSIHQIDLVPTLSFLLGLPVPFANLGSYAPSLTPSSFAAGSSAQYTATALALNAAQVWRYYQVYSIQTHRRLPGMDALHVDLQVAVQAFEKAIFLQQQNDKYDGHDDEEEERDEEYDDDELFVQAATLMKGFLQNALELGQRVWTRFDTTGMMAGIVLLALGMLLYAWPLLSSLLRTSLWISGPKQSHKKSNSGNATQDGQPQQATEIGLALILMLFLCGLLTFSNSYILEEENSVMFGLAILSMAVALRVRAANSSTTKTTTTRIWQPTLVLPLLSRLAELFVSGHGQDPSISSHIWAHKPVVFLTSTALLAILRFHFCNLLSDTLSCWQGGGMMYQAMADVAMLVLLAWSWWEKRWSRSGFVAARAALGLLIGSLVVALGQALFGTPSSLPVNKNMDDGKKTDASSNADHDDSNNRSVSEHDTVRDVWTIWFKILIGIMAVTGPSAATSALIYVTQVGILNMLSSMSTPRNNINARNGGTISPVVLASLLRMISRHAFFATNHGCAFNRLQLSAAFVATSEFYYHVGGISLFLNTFGWEMMGITLAWLLNQHGQLQPPNDEVYCTWRIYGLYQLVEAVTSCISVSVLRRHLMVWDIYAPHFIFAAIFTLLHGLAHLSALLLSWAHSL